MAPLPVELLFGIYLGFLAGIIPALVAFTLGFLFKYVTDLTIPAFGVVVLGVAVAGINGGLLALNDPNITNSEHMPALITALIVVLMITLYAHDKGDKLGARLPKRLTLKGLRERTLSADVVELVGGRGQVRVTVTGEVEDLEGYPPVSDDIRRGIGEGEWTLPADVPLAELERRFAERLKTEFGLADVLVTLDERARATVAAAPPLSALSKRVPEGKRAVSVNALVPTGLARGDEVTVRTAEGAIDGTVVSARSAGGAKKAEAAAKPETATDGGEEEPPAPPSRAPTTDGGDGRITVAVERSEAETVLGATDPTVVVRARGTRREFELVSLLRRAGRRFRKLSVRAGGPLDGVTLGELDVRESYGVVVLAVRRPDGWTIAPRGTTRITAKDEMFAVGTREELDAFAGAVA